MVKMITARHVVRMLLREPLHRLAAIPKHGCTCGRRSKSDYRYYTDPTRFHLTSPSLCAIGHLVIVLGNFQIKIFRLSGLGHFSRTFRILSFSPVLDGLARAWPPFFRGLHKSQKPRLMMKFYSIEQLKQETLPA